jgi:hypothetical protein
LAGLHLRRAIVPEADAAALFVRCLRHRVAVGRNFWCGFRFALLGIHDMRREMLFLSLRHVFIVHL